MFREPFAADDLFIGDEQKEKRQQRSSIELLTADKFLNFVRMRLFKKKLLPQNKVDP